jgi:hypothetical protein
MFVRGLGFLFVVSQSLLIVAAHFNPILPPTMEATTNSAGECDREAVELIARNRSDDIEADVAAYLIDRTQSPTALLLVASNILVSVYFALSLFATQTLYLKLLEFNESLERTETIATVAANPRSMNELRKSLGFMTDTTRTSQRAAVVLVLLFIIFTLPWLWPHQEYMYALFFIVLVPPFIAHLKTFAGDVRFGIDDSPNRMQAAAERVPLDIRIKGTKRVHHKEAGHTTIRRPPHHTRDLDKAQQHHGGGGGDKTSERQHRQKDSTIEKHNNPDVETPVESGRPEDNKDVWSKNGGGAGTRNHINSKRRGSQSDIMVTSTRAAAAPSYSI